MQLLSIFIILLVYIFCYHQTHTIAYNIGFYKKLYNVLHEVFRNDLKQQIIHNLKFNFHLFKG